MPYYTQALMGVCFLGLSALSGVGTIYCALYTRQLGRAYARWHKNTLRGGGYPSLSKHPDLSGKRGRRLRNTALVSLIVFALSFLVDLFLLFAYTGFAPFWHALEWFQP